MNDQPLTRDECKALRLPLHSPIDSELIDWYPYPDPQARSQVSRALDIIVRRILGGNEAA